MNIITFPNPVLLQKCEDVERIDPSFKANVFAMRDLLFQSDGVGLAGPQVGLLLNVFVTNFDPFIFINPLVVGKSKKVWAHEGCLSLPNVIVEVPRFSKAAVTYYDLDGKEHKRTFNDLEARIIQHEYDHLQGRLILEYQ